MTRGTPVGFCAVSTLAGIICNDLGKEDRVFLCIVTIEEIRYWFEFVDLLFPRASMFHWKKALNADWFMTQRAQIT
jgi:hypothetical protein